MARLGKTLREEEKGGGTGGNFFHFLYRPLEIYGDTPAERFRLLLAYVVLGLGLILLLSAHWIIAIGLTIPPDLLARATRIIR